MTNYQEKAREIVPTIYTSVMMGKSMGAEKLVVSALAQAEKDGMMQMAERCADLVVSEEVNDHASAFLEKKIRQLAKELNEEEV